MANKELVVAITSEGVSTDFSGFKGEKCFEESDEIRRRLKGLGITLNVKNSKLKEDDGPENPDGVYLTNPTKEKN